MSRAAIPCPVIAVIVTWHPEPHQLIRLLEAIRPQVHAAVIVDNGSNLPDCLLANRPPQEHWVRLPANRGLAAAQNIGIAQARRYSAEFVLLLDQDSTPAPGMVDILVAAARQLHSTGCSVAAVGPRHYDPRRRDSLPFVRLRGMRLRPVRCRDGNAVFPVDHVIASGALIPLTALERVGGMAEALFIDHVDIEWCLRARAHGFESYAACGAVMEHALGDAPLRIGPFTCAAHSPERHYYQLRNTLWLVRRPWLPPARKYALLVQALRTLGLHSLFGRPRIAHWRMMARGLWHGLRMDPQQKMPD
jgi:rhamnosyltransferase